MSGNFNGPGTPWGASPEGQPQDPNPQQQSWGAQNDPTTPGNGAAPGQGSYTGEPHGAWGGQQPDAPSQSSWSQSASSGAPSQPSWNHPPAADAQSQSSWNQTSAAGAPQQPWNSEQHQQPAGAPGQQGWGQEQSAQAGAYGQQYGTDQQQGAAYGAGAPAAANWDGSGQPPYAGAGAVAQAGGGHPSGPKKPWYKRPLILVLGIGGVVLLILAAVGIPLGIHLGNVAKGDQLAADFNTALEAHNATWTEEEIGKLSDIVVSDTLEENTDFYSQSASSMDTLQQRCEAVSTASGALTTLANSPVPTLEEAEGADASAEYQAAKTASDGLADRRSAVASLTGDGAAALSALNDFCTVFPEYNSIINAFGSNVDQFYMPTLSVANGSNIEFGNGLYMPCTASLGCPNYASQGDRTAHGDGIDASFTAFYTDMAAKSGSTCFLPEFADVCATMASEYDAVAAAYSKAAESIRTETPDLSVGQQPMPNFFADWSAAADAVDTADSNIASSWHSVDPDTQADSGTGWQARSIKSALSAHETVITDAVALLG